METQWRVGEPKTHCGVSPLCEVEYMNPYGYRLTTEAQWHSIEREWQEWPSGRTIDADSYRIVDDRYFEWQRERP